MLSPRIAPFIWRMLLSISLVDVLWPYRAQVVLEVRSPGEASGDDFNDGKYSHTGCRMQIVSAATSSTALLYVLKTMTWRG